MAEKTPVTVLQELCIQEGELVPIYDLMPDGDGDKTFTYMVHALEMCAKGSGRSKREAKHEASANLIAFLKELNRFKDKLKEVPPTPRPTSEIDAVGILLDICVQRNWPLATFDVQQACGQPHAPSFTIVCRLASIQRSGVFSTKKGAKQIAAQSMLNVIQRIAASSDIDKQIATLDAEPPEKVMRTYRELKKMDIKPTGIRLCERHNYFKRLPDEDKKIAFDIFDGKETMFSGRSSQDIVDLVCKALKITYTVDPVQKHPLHHKMFIINCNGEFDSVHVDKEELLYDKVLKYLKCMLNYKNVLLNFMVSTNTENNDKE